MSLFVRLTVLVALGVVALFVLGFILKALVVGAFALAVGAFVAALIIGGMFVVGFFRRMSSRPGPLVRR